MELATGKKVKEGKRKERKVGKIKAKWEDEALTTGEKVEEGKRKERKVRKI